MTKDTIRYSLALAEFVSDEEIHELSLYSVNDQDKRKWTILRAFLRKKHAEDGVMDADPT